MTKEELIKAIQDNTNAPRCWTDINTAIDAYTKDSLPQTESIDEAGHHSEWKYCPGCGFDWDIQMGADQFGCWNCGFIRKQQ